MNRNTNEMTAAAPAADYRFAFGVLAGTVFGAGLMMFLAPRAAAEARRTVADSASALRDRTADQLGQAGRRVVVAVDDLAAKGYGLRDDLADAVVNGAHEVERVAVAVKAVPPPRRR